MDREEFYQVCQQFRLQDDFSLSANIVPPVCRYREARQLPKLPVIWLETSDSGDNNIAFMNTTYPYLHQVFDGMIDLLYSNTFMAAQGRDALAVLQRAVKEYKGEYILVVEGAIPTKANGLYNVIARSRTQILTALAAVKWLGQDAKQVIALGTCASFGGASSAKPNITGSVGVSKVLTRPIINVSGCPVNPDWFVGTLAHLLLYGVPELDELNRPKLFYEFTIHQHCQRRSYFDKKEFAQELGDIECMFSKGCSGPRTSADCPYRQWINHVSWPVKVNTPCIGCTNQDFPDGSAPFFAPLPAKAAGEQTAKPPAETEKGATPHEPAKGSL